MAKIRCILYLGLTIKSKSIKRKELFKMLTLDETKIEIAQARKGISNTDLVKITGLSQVTINNIKNGKHCKPENVHSIAKALDVDPKDLIYVDPLDLDLY